MSKRTWKRWTEKEIERLIKYWESGLKVREIQEKFSKTRGAGAVTVKINSLQKAGKIKFRHSIKQAMPIPKTKVIVSSKTPKSEKEREIRRQCAKEIKELKDRLDKELETKRKLIKELSQRKQYHPFKNPEPPWVQAGKKAMQGTPISQSKPVTMHGKIAHKCDEIKSLLQTKNAQYGDSAMNPVRVFSKSDASEQLKVRIDDKLSRLVRGDDSLESDEEIVKDLIGYLVLLLIQYDTQSLGEGNA